LAISNAKLDALITAAANDGFTTFEQFEQQKKSKQMGIVDFN